jgi:hypothetical protein
MTTYTDDEFATHCLRGLGLIAAEETPTSADLGFAKTVNAAEIATLSAVGIPIWNGSNLAVPLEYLGPLSRYCSLALRPAFGLENAAQAEQERELLIRTLEKMAAPRFAPLTVRTDDAKRGGPWFNFTMGL